MFSIEHSQSSKLYKAQLFCVKFYSFLLCDINSGFFRKCQLVKEKSFGADSDALVETVTNISVFLNKWGLQSTEAISCFWAPLLCASLASGHVFVTDLAGICVLSPMDTLTSAEGCLACLKKPKFQRAGFLSGNNVLLVSVCVSILSF